MIDINKIYSFFTYFGPLGLFVLYLIRREDLERKEKTRLAEAEIASREKLTSVLTAIYIALTGKPYV